MEPFTGTGRILLPLAEDGHTLTGMDASPAMLARARAKIRHLPQAVQGRITLVEADVVSATWPRRFDLVILGGNCFYELATPQEQEQVVTLAARSLRPGGYVYVDNDHMEGDLDPAWQEPGPKPGWPTGTLPDSTRLESWKETVWFDAPRRLARFRRVTKATLPDGRMVTSEAIQQKHPVSTAEVRGWLEGAGFQIVHLFGDRDASAYTDESPRAIFWGKMK